MKKSLLTVNTLGGEIWADLVFPITQQVFSFLRRLRQSGWVYILVIRALLYFNLTFAPSIILSPIISTINKNACNHSGLIVYSAWISFLSLPVLFFTLSFFLFFFPRCEMQTSSSSLLTKIEIIGRKNWLSTHFVPFARCMLVVSIIPDLCLFTRLGNLAWL